MIDVTALGVGTPVPPFSRVGSFATWTHFAAVNHETADHHLDAEVVIGDLVVVGGEVGPRGERADPADGGHRRTGTECGVVDHR